MNQSTDETGAVITFTAHGESTRRELRRLLRHILDATEGDFKTIQRKHLEDTLKHVHRRANDALKLLNEEK